MSITHGGQGGPVPGIASGGRYCKLFPDFQKLAAQNSPKHATLSKKFFFFCGRGLPSSPDPSRRGVRSSPPTKASGSASARSSKHFNYTYIQRKTRPHYSLLPTSMTLWICLGLFVCWHNWRRQLRVTGARDPSTANNLFISVHFRVAQF